MEDGQKRESTGQAQQDGATEERPAQATPADEKVEEKKR